MENLAQKKETLLKKLQTDGVLVTPTVIQAFRDVAREAFIPQAVKQDAYVNEPLPIGEGQTISQPLTVAVMTEALDVHEGHHVLEIGTGSGYQAAILSKLVGPQGAVLTIEIRPELAAHAQKNLRPYPNVKVMLMSGAEGHQPHAPYDRIIVTAEASKVPQALLDQLKPEGILVIPVQQQLFVLTKREKIYKTSLGRFRFVPLCESL
ncbi:MAG: protein-L-isoaspartate(D-aspartate) O-methyltransferase [Candidatus Aenigmarchaeota archaeon]|nr:protein-L-isoaspartate(D-aspartate) O-methyltransferase [Candidatus Aenigmarchaeota archaeon]